MNLPKSVDDPSLLEQEPLCTHLAIYEALDGRSRQGTKDLFSSFAKAVRQDDQATAAARIWAYLMFKDVLSDEYSFEFMDQGEELYNVFLQYQFHLRQGMQLGNTDRAREYQAWIVRLGTKRIKLKCQDVNAQHSAKARGRGGRSNGIQPSFRSHKTSGPKKGRRQVRSGVQPLDTSLAHPPVMGVVRSDLTEPTEGPVTSLNPEFGTGSVVDSQAPCSTSSATGVRLSTLPEVAKSSIRSTSKREKKRKASSQKPPVTSPDASEDDKEPSEADAVTVANSAFHRSKRVASDHDYQPHNLHGVKHQVIRKHSTHKSKINKQSRSDIDASQPQSTLTGFQIDALVLPSIKDQRSTGFPFKERKCNKTRHLNTSSQLTRTNAKLRKLRKAKSTSDLQTRPAKRSRRPSVSTTDGNLVEGSEFTPFLEAKRLRESTIEDTFFTGLSSTQETNYTEVKVRRKRTRVEFETGIAVSSEKASADSHEFLGPDNRSLRPLPQKVCNGQSVPATEESTAVCGVLCGTLASEHAGQPLRDSTSSVLASLREEEVGIDIPDWTQDDEHDAEYDDFSGCDQDEAYDAQVTSSTPIQSTIMHKPPLPTPPRIWAQSRQEVCEAFEYFRCYHGGVYSKDDIVKGYLLGAYAASRDVFEHGGKLIISHGGGKSESILESRRGPRRFQTDQNQEASDKSVRALLKTYKDQRPIALLADDKYALFPYDLTTANHTYVVLGFYWISHAWAECQPTRDGSGRIVRWKFAFQWCEGQGDPWWSLPETTTDVASIPAEPVPNPRTCLTKDSSHPASVGNSSIQCETCREQSPFIYEQGWMCLNPHCNAFWSINGENPEELNYRMEFLSLFPKKFKRLPDLIPSRVTEMPGSITTTYASSKGWHCAKCGRLSSRYKWECWECANCKSQHLVEGRLRSPKEFWHQRPPKGFLHSHIGKDSGILASRLEPINLGTHKGFTNRLTFVLPHERGKIHLVLGTPLSNRDADDVFQLYQQQASTGELKLRRYPLRNHKARGPLLTNYFSQNSGEPYQYVGGSGQTIPFCEAPDCVRKALELIQERSSLAMHTDIPFNEVLSAAYMERQKMSFHSDNEKGLGPIVASLSMGSTALMHFRQHACIDDQKSKSAHALTLVLRHGDVLIMEGEGVQKFYEHTVIPMNFRIAATARCIGTV